MGSAIFPNEQFSSSGKNRLIDLSGKQVVQQLPLIDGSVNALEAFMIIRQSSLLEASEEAVTTEELD